ncbi:GIY-YIG nuclease family protein [Mesomycoplasma conjunctivae]|uniref:GIY-YIG nuclease family protein n=1 Tax=Mesomycoplasma conjunctivae TaxID=45361 RepID=UPI003DA5F4DF
MAFFLLQIWIQHTKKNNIAKKFKQENNKDELLDHKNAIEDKSDDELLDKQNEGKESRLLDEYSINKLLQDLHLKQQDFAQALEKDKKNTEIFQAKIPNILKWFEEILAKETKTIPNHTSGIYVLYLKHPNFEKQLIPFYIGKSVNIRTRFYNHKLELKKVMSFYNKDKKPFFYDGFIGGLYSKIYYYIDIYNLNLDDLCIQILEEVPKDRLYQKEAEWINDKKSDVLGFNETIFTVVMQPFVRKWKYNNDYNDADIEKIINILTHIFREGIAFFDEFSYDWFNYGFSYYNLCAQINMHWRQKNEINKWIDFINRKIQNSKDLDKLKDKIEELHNLYDIFEQQFDTFYSYYSTWRFEKYDILIKTKKKYFEKIQKQRKKLQKHVFKNNKNINSLNKN